MTQETARQRFRDAAHRGNLAVSRASIDGHSLGELVGVDSAKGKEISPLNVVSIEEVSYTLIDERVH